jgi:hypothetical protein
MFGFEVTWLEKADASKFYELAMDCSSRTYYGLNPDFFDPLERLSAIDCGPEVREWLSERVGSGEESLVLVFGKEDACIVRASFFLDRWQDLICPSRDDVIILPLSGGWKLCYCHEDEFEFSRALR